MEAYKFVIQTTNGEWLRTTDEHTRAAFIGLINRGASIECETVEMHKADRTKWEVPGAHVVKFREAT